MSDVQEFIRETVTQHPVVLFMKALPVSGNAAFRAARSRS